MSYPCDIFCEATKQITIAWLRILTGSVQASLISDKFESYDTAIHEKFHAVDNCIRFIDGTVIGVSKPAGCKHS